MNQLNIIAGLTITALALYYFVGKSEESSKLIRALAEGYSQTVKTLQGR